MGKRKHQNPTSLDSLLDILTCLQGALMFIIMMTGIDAAQTRITLATPIEVPGNERPIFIECRNNALFLVPLDEAREAIKARQMELLALRRKNTRSPALEEKNDIQVGSFTLDFNRYASGQIALLPKKDANGRDADEGYRITDPGSESEQGWYGGLLSRMNRDQERINFVVRDDSFEIFKIARILAWAKNIKVTYTLVSHNDPLIF